MRAFLLRFRAGSVRRGPRCPKELPACFADARTAPNAHAAGRCRATDTSQDSWQPRKKKRKARRASSTRQPGAHGRCLVGARVAWKVAGVNGARDGGRLCARRGARRGERGRGWTPNPLPYVAGTLDFVGLVLGRNSTNQFSRSAIRSDPKFILRHSKFWFFSLS